VSKIKSNFDLKRKRPREKVTTELHAALSRLLRDSIKEYLREAVKHVKVDTGMSRGSLLPLARMLRIYTEIRSTIHPKVESRQGSFDMEGEWHKDIPRTLDAGIESSHFKEEFNILYGTPYRPVFKFEYRISVWQWYINENGFGSDEAWEAMAQAEEAMKNYFDSNWKEYVKDALHRVKWLQS